MINRLRENFTQVDNKVLNDKELSLKAKGLYAFLCSKPNDWSFSYRGLQSQLQEGEKAIKGAVKELVNIGVLLRFSVKKGNSFDGWEWIINPTESDKSKYLDPIKTAKKGGVQKGGVQKGVVQKGGEISNTVMSNTKGSNTKEKERDNFTKSPNTTQDKTPSVLIDYYNQQANKKLQTSKTRCNKLKTRLKNFSCEEIKQAIKNWCNDDWIKNNQLHNIDGLIKNDEQIDKWLNKECKDKTPAQDWKEWGFKNMSRFKDKYGEQKLMAMLDTIYN